MGLIIGLLKRIFKLFIYIAIFIAIVLVIPNLPPYTKFTEIKLEQTLPRTGGLSYNEAFNNAQKLLTGKLIGPEAFRLFDGELYTGLATGEVVKISPGGHITFVTKIGQPCTGIYQEHICGRPLGLDIDEKNRLLYVADSYHGIWKVDLKTDKKQLLVSPNVEIDGRQVKIFNGIALDKNGNFYWTHSSSEFDLKDGALTCLSDPSGRLLYYNSAKNKSEVLLNDLWFANGLAISSDNQFVVVAESSKYQIAKYFINGPKKGKSEVFISGLPGIPDNLRVLPDGSGVLVALYTAFDDDHPLISRSLAFTPMARKFLARLSRMIEIPFEFINEHYPHIIFQEIVYKIGHFSSLSSIMPQMSGFVQIDWDGNVVASYFNTDKSYGTSSDAIVYNDKLYIASPHSSYIASVPVPPLLKKAFATSQSKSTPTVKIEEKKVSETKADTTATRQPVKEEKIKVVKVKDLNKADTQASNTDKKFESNDKKNPKPIESKPIKKEPEAKPKPAETKPVIKESEIKSKPAETKPVIKEPEIKPVVTKPVKEEVKPKPAESKTIKKETETKSKPVDTKPIITESDPKLKPIETKPAQKEPEMKPKAVESKTVKQAEAKQQSLEEKQKKENEPKSKPVETKPIKTDPQSKPEPAKSKESIKRSDEKQKVDPETVKVNSPTEKPKVQKSKDKESPKKSNDKQKPVPDQIPVTEEIPSDSVKPSKETLKVIKKSGPVEIPNPN